MSEQSTDGMGRYDGVAECPECGTAEVFTSGSCFACGFSLLPDDADPRGPFVKICPDCREWCDFDSKQPAKQLAENHDENFHGGRGVSVVLSAKETDRSDGE